MIEPITTRVKDLKKRQVRLLGLVDGVVILSPLEKGYRFWGMVKVARFLDILEKMLTLIDQYPDSTGSFCVFSCGDIRKVVDEVEMAILGMEASLTPQEKEDLNL